MKKFIKIVISLLTFSMLFGCTQLTSKEKLKFTVEETGQTVAIAVNEKDGYAVVKENGVPYIKKDDETIFTCTFITFDQYSSYREEIVNDTDNETYTYYKEGTKKKNKYVYFESNIDGTERYSYIVEIIGTTNANTGVLLVSETDRDTAQAAFKKTTLSIDIYAN